MASLSFQKSTHVITGPVVRTHVLVATVSGRIYQQAFSDSRQEAVLHAIEAGIDVTNLHITDCRIDESRNFAVVALRETAPPVEFLVFLDDDMLLPHDIIPRLVGNAVKFEGDVVGCLYTSRSIPPRVIGLDVSGQPIQPEDAMRLHEEKLVIDVGAVGFGATLVRASMFDRIHKPYFSFAGGESEDFGFCRKVREAHGRVLCDFGVESRLHGKTYPGIGHLGVYPYSLRDSESE
jgi:hypothetical protein